MYSLETVSLTKRLETGSTACCPYKNKQLDATCNLTTRRTKTFLASGNKHTCFYCCNDAALGFPFNPCL